MARRDRKEREPRARAVAPALAALLEAGDHRAAAARARELLADPATPAPERAAAEATLARASPEPGALVAAVIGLAIIAAVAALGLFLRV
jgi:hypothetical protein